MQSRAIFFDRDGIVNRRRVDDYVKRIEELEILPDVGRVLAEIHNRGFLAIIVTNQRGIARGLMTEDHLAAVHAHLQTRLFAESGHRFDAIYWCPHERDEGCACRKPRPGMLLQAASEHNIDLGGSWMIGDAESDVEAGRAAGCRTALVAIDPTGSRADVIAGSLVEVWRLIEEA